MTSSKISNKVFKGLKLTEFVVFDIETTGFNTFTDRIIELAGVKYKNGKVVEKFSELIDPEVMINETITKITGISNDAVLGKEKIDTILPKFISFIDGLPLVAHNLKFDIGFVEYWIQVLRIGKTFKTKNFYDTLVLSQIFFPHKTSNHKLGTLADFLEIKYENLHRALDDCKVTGELFFRIIEEAIDLKDNTIKKLTHVASKSETDNVKGFFINLFNYYQTTAFDRRLNEDETKYSSSTNKFEKLNDLDGFEIDDLTSENIVEKIFKEDGLLHANLKKFEYREEQYLFAKKSLEALNNQKFLISEAGTGVGKSYAYLIPAIITSIVQDEKVIISTNTKNLQEQIFYKDIPVLHDLFKESFQSVILKGRSNYLCKKRYESICQDPLLYLEKKEIDKFLPLVVWAEKTRTGDIEENSGFKRAYSMEVWKKTASETGFCLGKKCPHYKECFLQTIRKAVFNSNIIIINHSLLFSDLVTDNAVLKEYNYLIIDEAHNIEAAATKYMATEYNLFNLRGLCSRVSSFDGKRGAVSRLSKAIVGTSAIDKGKISILEDLSRKLKEKSYSLFTLGKEIFDDIGSRLYKKDAANSHQKIVKKRYKDSYFLFKGLRTKKSSFKKYNEELISFLKSAKTVLTALKSDSFSYQDEIVKEFNSLYETAVNLYDSFNFFENSKRENYVFWYEINKNEKGLQLNLNAAPLNISSILQKSLYGKLKTAILTSATLTIEGRFRYMKKKLGLSEIDESRLETLKLGSPFDLKNQLKIIVPSYFATPKQAAIFENDLKKLTTLLCTEFDTGTLALFTSYKMMNDVRSYIKDDFQEMNKLLLVQGKDGSRTDIMNQFKNVRNSFLFGTNSFWEGVDIPGEALEALLIVKLPFAVPTEPVIEARIEQIEASGKNSFMFYSVPEAILKFKQGIGRVVRSHNDKGIIYILDSRVVNTMWGEAFMNSLPVKPFIAKSLSEVKGLTEKFS